MVEEPTFDDIELVHVEDAKYLDGYRVWFKFSNGAEGIKDFADMIAHGGEMVVPLADTEIFSSVHVEMGAPTWSNGFDIDPSYLLWQIRQNEPKTP